MLRYIITKLQCIEMTCTHDNNDIVMTQNTQNTMPRPWHCMGLTPFFIGCWNRSLYPPKRMHGAPPCVFGTLGVLTTKNTITLFDRGRDNVMILLSSRHLLKLITRWWSCEHTITMEPSYTVWHDSGNRPFSKALFVRPVFLEFPGNAS